jgi:reductive dehalogenase
MRFVDKPTYTRFITGELRRFDDRNTAFSRGAVDGQKYTRMHDQSLANLAKAVPGKTILDHATWVAGRTGDYTIRRAALGRECQPYYNRTYRLRDPNPAAMSRIVKQTAAWIGADRVGIARLNPLWIYTHWGMQNVHYSGAAQAGDPIEIPPEYQTVIVMIHRMDYDVILRSPAVEHETDIGYSKAAWSAASLATFITELGYKAIPACNELGISIAMAVDAGLGEMGRNGQLITRDFGASVRISKVFTNLPLVPDRPVDLGVQGFCERCALCAKHCPSRSIPAGERTDQPNNEHTSPGMLKWPVHAMKCLDWWVKNGAHCSICIRVCPWTKPNNFLHRLVRPIAERNIATPLLVKIDQMLGYGRQSKNLGFGQDPGVVEVNPKG